MTEVIKSFFSRAKISTTASKSKAESEKAVASTSVAASSKKGKPSKTPLTFIGPMLPALKPEEIARQKVLKFEDDLASSIIFDIKNDIPPDWARDGALKVSRLFAVCTVFTRFRSLRFCA